MLVPCEDLLEDLGEAYATVDSLLAVVRRIDTRINDLRLACEATVSRKDKEIVELRTQLKAAKEHALEMTHGFS